MKIEKFFHSILHYKIVEIIYRIFFGSRQEQILNTHLHTHTYRTPTLTYKSMKLHSNYINFSCKN